MVSDVVKQSANARGQRKSERFTQFSVIFMGMRRRQYTRTFIQIYSKDNRKLCRGNDSTEIAGIFGIGLSACIVFRPRVFESIPLFEGSETF